MCFAQFFFTYFFLLGICYSFNITHNVHPSIRNNNKKTLPYHNCQANENRFNATSYTSIADETPIEIWQSRKKALTSTLP